MMGNSLTTAQAAAALHVTARYVRKLCQAGTLVGVRTEQGWLIDADSLAFARPSRPKQARRSEEEMNMLTGTRFQLITIRINGREYAIERCCQACGKHVDLRAGWHRNPMSGEISLWCKCRACLEPQAAET